MRTYNVLMAWKASSVMEEKLRFVFAYERDEESMAVPTVWDLPRDRLCVAAALSPAGSRRAGGVEPGAAASSQPDAAGHRRSGAGSAPGAYAAGAAQAEADPGARSAGTIMAGDQHHRGDRQPCRAGGGAAHAAQNRTLQRTAPACRGVQPRLVRRLQGLVEERRRSAHRSVDHQRCLEPLSAALPGGGENKTLDR